jgi:thioredoxin-like negative regulator of GroEL
MKKIIYFHSKNCKNSIKFSPFFEKISKDPKYKDIIFIPVEITNENNLTIKYKIKSVPYLIRSEDGTVNKEIKGILTESELRKFIEY